MKVLNYKKIAFGIVILGSALLLSGCKKNTQTNNISTLDNNTTEATSGKSAATVTMTDAGFDPSTVTINAGESITWVNNSSKTVQVGSADHPTHTKNSSLTGGQFVIDLKAGESKTVSAGTNVGIWGYHNHLNPTVFGKVVIE